MGVCDIKIASNMKRDCSAPPLVQGVEETYFVGHVSSISAITPDGSNPLLISAIALKSGQKLAIYQGYDLNTKPSMDTVNRTDYGVLTPHKMQIAILYNSAAKKLEIQKLIKSKDLFFIYKKSGIGGEYEAMGLQVGMRCTGINYDLAGESKGAFVLTFEGPDADTLPHTIKHVTSGTEDTETYLTGLSFTDV